MVNPILKCGRLFMMASQMQSIGIRSCEDMIEYVTNKRLEPRKSQTSKITIEIVDYKPEDGYVIFYLGSKISDTDNLQLQIGDSKPIAMQFDNYNEVLRSIYAYPTDDQRTLIDSADISKMKLVVDMLWLVSLTKNFFETYGNNFGLSHTRPHFIEGKDYTCPLPNTSEEQKSAVNMVLNNRLSYVWGAPGTGKTQYVLATAIIAYLKKGERVAIVAPTNHAVEQVLRGLLQAIKLDEDSPNYINPSDHIIRLGSATHDFIKHHKELCEDKMIEKRIAGKKAANRSLNNEIIARNLVSLSPELDSIERTYEEFYDTADHQTRKEIQFEMREKLDKRIIPLLSSDQRTISLTEGLNEFSLRNNLDRIRSRISELPPSPEYKKYSMKDLEDLIAKNNETISELEKHTTKSRLKKAKIIAMTQFILMGRKELMSDGGIKDVAHIFLDEAGYANLIQSASIFMCGPPVTLLGDHKQLPPVCEIDEKEIVGYSERGYDGYMAYSVLWDRSVLYIEELINGSIEDLRQKYPHSEPYIEKTSTLTHSFRFANNMAEILNRIVYQNGFTGVGKSNLKITCYDVRNTNEMNKRYNEGEIRAITHYLSNNIKPGENFCVLTPYVLQRRRLMSRNENFRESILTIHSSQGREWDKVIISVVDNRSSLDFEKDCKLHFTSSIKPNTGLKVMNTALSRAKKELVIFCDYDFWKTQSEDDLLAAVVAQCNNVVR